MGIIGVDEAGKGPVLGSMFVAAVRIASPGGCFFPSSRRPGRGSLPPA